MKLVFAADLHGNEQLYNKLFSFIKEKKIKNVILGGDLSPHIHGAVELGVKAQNDFFEWLVKEIKKMDTNFFLIMGNDDFGINASVIEKADKDGILKFIHMKVKKINGRL